MFSLTFLPYAKCRKCKLENILLGIIDNFINCISVHSMFRKKKTYFVQYIYTLNNYITAGRLLSE